MDAERFFTHSLQDRRVARILAAALDAVDSGTVVERYLASHTIPEAERIFALGLGKAAVPMTAALSRHTDLVRALVITKHASSLDLEFATVVESGHPVPDERSQAAGEAALEFVAELEADDLLIPLISGGGSALMTAPLVPLEDLRALTTSLLACGARIDEINTLRRHLDRVKGGGIAKATRAKILSLILSDVVGDPLEAIASGPTVADPSTREDALNVLAKYFPMSLHGAVQSGAPVPRRGTAKSKDGRRGNLLTPNDKKLLRSARNDMDIPSSITHALSSIPETPKPDDLIFERVQNVIVGNNPVAAQAAMAKAQNMGFDVEYLRSTWQGEAREVGIELARKLRVAKKDRQSPFCLVAGGETTVTLRHSSGQALLGDGKGGRNQELALAAVPELAGLESALLISLASDGEDGLTDAAGAVVTGETLQRAESRALDAADYLYRNDSYAYFQKLGDLLRIGPTGTNVNDLVFLFSIE